MIQPGSVKICSLREVEHARFVLDAGADLFGLIFVPGVRRQVTIERAAAIVAAVRSDAIGRLPLAVGVFVDATVEEVNRTTESVGLDLAQLQGTEPPEMLSDLVVPVIKAIRPPVGQHVDEVKRELETFMNAPTPPIAFHIEGLSSGLGGEGARADWELAAELARKYPVILAGGLSPDNVAGAIATVTPAAVDVSSGVETNGIKDSAKILAFVHNAKTAYRALPKEFSQHFPSAPLS